MLLRFQDYAAIFKMVSEYYICIITIYAGEHAEKVQVPWKWIWKASFIYPETEIKFW